MSSFKEKLDAFHYHEALDRSAMICDMIDTFLIHHPVTKAEKEFAEKLVKDYGVAVIPMSAFYHDATDNKVIRLCFAKKEATLEAAAACLQKL